MNITLKITSWILVTFLSSISWSQNAVTVQMETLKTLSSVSQPKIRLVLNQAIVNVTANTASQELSIKAESGTVWEWSEEAGVQVLRQKSQNQAKVFVHGGSTAIEIYASNASLTVNGWTKNLTAVLQKGSFKSKETSGELKANVLFGEVEVSYHTGNINLESFDAKTTLNLVKGDVALNQHSGTASLESVEGRIKVLSAKSKMKVNGGSGDLDFLTRQGGFQIAGFKGSIEGVSEQGAIALKSVDVVDVRLQSKEGLIDLMVPVKSAAGINIETVEGRLQTPKFLKTSNLGSASVTRGKLRGDIPGRVHVKTQSGTVSLKTF